MLRDTELYFESHVTIDPVFGERRDQAAGIATLFNFRMAHLIMRKTLDDMGTVHTDDSFMTGHSINYADIHDRTKGLVKALRADGHTVRRYKIEDTVCDSRYGDTLGLL